MTHLAMEQLLQLRSATADVGTADARAHLEGCARCQAELDRLHQRVARLKALPALRPPRDLWAGVRDQVLVERRRRRGRWAGIGGLAMAASVVLALLVTVVASAPEEASATAALDSVKAQSRHLEDAIRQLGPERRVMDGRTARITAELEERIARLDRQLQSAQLVEEMQEREQHMLQLWRERVGLLDALVDVHVTRASHVGL